MSGLRWQDLDLDALAALVADDDKLQFVPGLPPTREPGPAVPVHVEDIGAGAWVQVTGTTGDGTPVTVVGAVVGGPDPVGEDGEVYAVAVRTHVAGEPDVVVYVGDDQPVLLVDAPCDYAARAAHALAPVYGPVTKAIMLKWEGPDRRNGVWVEQPPVYNPTAEQLAQMERGGPDIMLSAVYRGHLPATSTD